jgi:hypothetical protein
MEGHPYRTPGDPGEPTTRPEPPRDRGGIALVAALFVLGLCPVAAALARGHWSAEASLGTALALFGGWHLFAEIAGRS